MKWCEEEHFRVGNEPMNKYECIMAAAIVLSLQQKLRAISEAELATEISMVWTCKQISAVAGFGIVHGMISLCLSIPGTLSSFLHRNHQQTAQNIQQSCHLFHQLSKESEITAQVKNRLLSV